MPSEDVLIIGAGAAGLSAAIDLARSGMRVTMLEARERVGGRILTKRDTTLNHAVELGAEFVHSLRADEVIEGDRAFRIAGGYHTLIDILLNQLNQLNVALELSTTVREIKWRPGSIQISAQTLHGDKTFTAPRALITLPLGVLQAAPDSIRIEPDLPREKLHAMEKLAMGKVVRVTLCFRDRFWRDIRPSGESKTLADMSFLLSRDELFPTWWTEMA